MRSFTGRLLKTAHLRSAHSIIGPNCLGQNAAHGIHATGADRVERPIGGIRRKKLRPESSTSLIPVPKTGSNLPPTMSRVKKVLVQRVTAKKA